MGAGFALSPNDLGESGSAGAAKCAASGAQNGDFDPDLQTLIHAWLELSADAKRSIIEVVEAALAGIPSEDPHP